MLVLVPLGLAKSLGVVSLASGAGLSSDAVLHVTVGFVLGLAAGWLAAPRGPRWVVAAFVTVALIGVATEPIQRLLSMRSMQVKDIVMHEIGMLAAVVVFLAARRAATRRSAGTAV